MHGQLVAVLGDPAQLVDVAHVEHRVDALAVHVHGQRDDVDVAGALTVAEQRALDPIGAGHDAELGGGDAGAPVVVRMQAQDDVVAPAEVAMHPLDHVAIDVGGGHLDGGRQVDDHLVGRRRVETSITVSQIRLANGNSVPVNDSGEYS